MTRTTNARIAGFTYLFYAAIGICSELLMHHARGGGERSPDLNPADFSEPTLFSKVKEKAARESGLLLFVPRFVPNGSKFNFFSGFCVFSLLSTGAAAR